jgi:hypothetical protein
MKQFNIVALSVMVVAFALSPGNTIAQQTSLKEQLVGAWTLVSCDRTTASSAKQPYCVNPNGILLLDVSGRYAHMIAARDRPKLTVVNREAPAEQFKAVAQGFVANFGIWSVNEQEMTITRHYEGALLPNYEGTDSKMSVSLAGDELTLTDPKDGQPFYAPNADLDYGRIATVYRRVK